MAIAIRAAGGGGRARRRRHHGGAVMNEINMTPFIDVVLVLLIIFMVAAPLMTSSVPIDLPEAKGKPSEGQVKPVTVSVDPTGKVYIGDAEVKMDELVSKLQAIAKNGVDERIVFQGDKAAIWGTTSKVLGELNSAGFHKIAIQMQPN
ncbi:MAG: biopolymer transporter ExbD [Ancalomicrobiaceae bacterium]|nr:biopolymer transporter ExbD [Ancalomicrobiaceae bacterium]